MDGAPLSKYSVIGPVRYLGLGSLQIVSLPLSYDPLPDRLSHYGYWKYATNEHFRAECKIVESLLLPADLIFVVPSA